LPVDTASGGLGHARGPGAGGASHSGQAAPPEDGPRPEGVIASPPELSRRLDQERASGATVGLVPTMGALHRGHGELIRRAAAECDLVVVSVFVNPLQFGPGEDFDRYPRSLPSDVELARAAGADLVFAPSVGAMYPEPMATTVQVEGLNSVLEGAFRPGHLDGVSTVVAKLFACAGRCRAYFGEKDWQQLALVRRLARDLSLPVEVVGVETVRESDGLALSSRNAYLSADERRTAPLLSLALSTAAGMVADGEGDPVTLSSVMVGVLASEPELELDYAVAVEPDSLLAPIMFEPGDPVRLLLAARLGATRLIDNLGAVVGVPVSIDLTGKADPACAGA
jgi:pantoate--beta-alanine ligase